MALLSRLQIIEVRQEKVKTMQKIESVILDDVLLFWTF